MTSGNSLRAHWYCEIIHQDQRSYGEKKGIYNPQHWKYEVGGGETQFECTDQKL